jgi:hypothetical protein
MREMKIKRYQLKKAGFRRMSRPEDEPFCRRENFRRQAELHTASGKAKKQCLRK